MGRTTGTSRLVLFGEGDLLRSQTFLSVDGTPRGGGMAATQEFLVDALMATAAVAGSQMGTDHEAVMVHLLLSVCRLMAVEAVDSLAGVGAHLVFVYDRVLGPGMALGTLS